MLHSNYNRAPRRKLIPNLFSSILQVIADSDHPLSEPEIVVAISERLNRSDEELKRQITVGLQDALITGYLRIKNLRYSVKSNRLDRLQNPAPRSPSGSARVFWHGQRLHITESSRSTDTDDTAGARIRSTEEPE